MSDFPGFGGFSSTIISSRDRKYGPWPTGTATNNAVWTTANIARYYPVLVPEPTIVTKIAVRIGTSSGNLDLGIYDEQGVRLVSSGSTAMAATSTMQVIDITDTLLTPGVYYLAIAVDNTTASFNNINNSTGPLAGACSMMGIRQEASAFPLPATATFAATTSDYLMTITCTTRIPVL